MSEAPGSPPRSPNPPSPLKARLYALAQRPSFELTICVLIAISILAVLAEPAFAVGSPERRALVHVNDVLALVFTAELTLRYWLAPIKRRFFFRYLADLIAIVPQLWASNFLRVLMLLRLFRFGTLLSRVLRRRGGRHHGPPPELSLLASISAVIGLFGAFTLTTFQGSAELDTGGWEGSLWYAAYTMIAAQPTGGNPTTQLGRAVTLAFMLGGMAVFGVFIATVSAVMVQVIARRLEHNTMDIDELTEHVVVCGWNSSGPPLLRELFAPGNPPGRAVVVISERKADEDMFPSDLPRDLIYHYRGDYTNVDVLEAAGIRRTSTAILLADTSAPRSAQDQDARTVLAALTIERLSPGIFCCAELHEEQHASLLRLQGVEEVVVSNQITGVILGSVGRTRGLMPVLGDVLSAQRENAFYKAGIPAAYVGWRAGDLHRYLKEHHEAILVSLERHGDPAHRCGQIVNPGADERVQAGDVAVVISRGNITLAERPVDQPRA